MKARDGLHYFYCARSFEGHAVSAGLAGISQATGNFSCWHVHCTLTKKDNTIFLIYKEIQMESGAKSYIRRIIGGRAFQYMRKCAYYSPYMRRPSVICDFAPDPSEFPYI
jgi:hypothetical protein